MTTPQIHDGFVQRQMTNEEYAEWQTLVNDVAERRNKDNDKLNQLNALRVKLAALGLTDDEVSALIP